MGTSYRKLTYTCQCGCDYGDCGRTNVFVYAYHRTSDIGALYWSWHGGKLELIGHFNDADMDALLELLNSETSDPMTPDEFGRIEQECREAFDEAMKQRRKPT